MLPESRRSTNRRPDRRVVPDARRRLVVAEHAEPDRVGVARREHRVDAHDVARHGQRLGAVGDRPRGIRVRPIRLLELRELGHDLLREARTLGRRHESHVAGQRVRAAPRARRDVVRVVPVVHPAEHHAPAVGRVRERHRRVVVPAPVEPVVALDARRGRGIREHHLVDEHVAPAEPVVVDDANGCLAAGVLRDVPAHPVEGLAVAPGRRAHDLAVDDEADRRLLGARQRRLGAEHEVVDGEVAPAARRVVVHLELRITAGELRDVPRLPVELAGLGTGGRAHDLAVDEEPHLERAVEPLAAAEEEREVVLAGLDRERRRGEVAEVVVALRAALPGVDALLARGSSRRRPSTGCGSGRPRGRPSPSSRCRRAWCRRGTRSRRTAGARRAARCRAACRRRAGGCRRRRGGSRRGRRW